MATKETTKAATPAQIPEGFAKVDQVVHSLTLGDVTEKGEAIKHPMRSVTGYFCGSRHVTTNLGDSMIHRFALDAKAEKIVDVWGNAALDRQLATIKHGTMCFAAPSGEVVKSAKKNDVKLFNVAIDANDRLKPEALDVARASMGDTGDAAY
jgi:hypothetical protein